VSDNITVIFTCGRGGTFSGLGYIDGTQGAEV